MADLKGMGAVDFRDFRGVLQDVLQITEGEVSKSELLIILDKNFPGKVSDSYDYEAFMKTMSKARGVKKHADSKSAPGDVQLDSILHKIAKEINEGGRDRRKLKKEFANFDTKNRGVVSYHDFKETLNNMKVDGSLSSKVSGLFTCFRLLVLM